MSIIRTRRNRSVSTVSSLEQRTLLAAVNVISSRGAQGSVNLTFEGSASNDFVHIQKDPITGKSIVSAENLNGWPNLPTTFRLNGGTEVVQLTFEKLGKLKFNLGAGDDIAYIRNVSAGDISITDGIGESESNSYVAETATGAMKLGDVKATFDRGKNYLRIGDAYESTDGTIEVGAVAVRGTTLSRDVRVQLIEHRNPASVTVKGLVSLDLPESSTGESLLSLVSYTPGLTLIKGIRQTGGAGFDQFQTIGSVSIKGNVEIMTRGGYDNVSTETGAATFHGKVNINTGSGEDHVELYNPSLSGPVVHFMKDVTINTGADNDYVNMNQVVFHQALTIDAGTSSVTDSEVSNWVRLFNMEVFGSTQVISSQWLTVYIAPSTNSKLHLHGPAEFTLGQGQLNIDSTSANVYFDQQLIFRGQPNQIQVNYYGQVNGDPANRTLINAELLTH